MEALSTDYVSRFNIEHNRTKEIVQIISVIVMAILIEMRTEWNMQHASVEVTENRRAQR